LHDLTARLRLQVSALQSELDAARALAESSQSELAQCRLALRDTQQERDDAQHHLQEAVRAYWNSCTLTPTLFQGNWLA
jgi:chromosome segregation ATPase